MQPIPPFWFLQRQGKVEVVDSETVRLTAPNLGEAFISIRGGDNGRWLAALRSAKDGPEIATTQAELPTPPEAWAAAFELYRIHCVV
jgi:hypothetical protein